MHENRRKCWGFIKLPILLTIFAITFSSCSVYTIKKSDLESKLRPRTPGNCCKGLNSLTTMYNKQYINNIDTLTCSDAVGEIKIKRITYDSKITIVTRSNKSIKYYAKTLYIWKEEFLIGECSSPSLYGPNYFPVRLSDISRIEVKKPWFKF